MKKYLSLLMVALFATLSSISFDINAQHNQKKTITIAEISKQAEVEIAKEKEGEAQTGNVSIILSTISNLAEKEGITLEECYFKILKMKYEGDGYTIIDEQPEQEKNTKK